MLILIAIATFEFALLGATIWVTRTRAVPVRIARRSDGYPHAL